MIAHFSPRRVLRGVVGCVLLLAAVLFSLASLTSLSLYARATGTVAVIALALELMSRVASARRRRLLVSSWRRLTMWEFWPPWLFYPPVVAYIAFLMLKHRSATLFTAANPAIVAGGFVGESKHAILQALAGAREYVARSRLLPGALSPLDKLREAQRFMTDEALTFPIVLKPDRGQRGSGVVVVRSPDALEDCLARSSVDTIIQEYVAGAEFGVFYYRRPSESRGHIFSVTEKRFPSVVGDGRSTLEELILDDDRAVCAARLYCERHRDRLSQIPSAGESIPLVELGTHCRGAMFLDGGWILTPALAHRFDAIARQFDGFYFGRFDVRVAEGIEAFRDGSGFKIVELNGVTSEATHIYHPGTVLTAAYRVLMAQWRFAFDIGAENRRRWRRLHACARARQARARLPLHHSIAFRLRAQPVRQPRLVSAWCGTLRSETRPLFRSVLASFFLLVSGNLRRPVACTVDQDDSAAGEPGALVASEEQMVRELVALSFANLEHADIRLKSFRSNSDYFRTSFSAICFLAGVKMRYFVFEPEWRRQDAPVESSVRFSRCPTPTACAACWLHFSRSSRISDSS